MIRTPAVTIAREFESLHPGQRGTSFEVMITILALVNPPASISENELDNQLDWFHHGILAIEKVYNQQLFTALYKYMGQLIELRLTGRQAAMRTMAAAYLSQKGEDGNLDFFNMAKAKVKADIRDGTHSFKGWDPLEKIAYMWIRAVCNKPTIGIPIYEHSIQATTSGKEQMP
jgi:hypothetical protein